MQRELQSLGKGLSALPRGAGRGAQPRQRTDRPCEQVVHVPAALRRRDPHSALLGPPRADRPGEREDGQHRHRERAPSGHPTHGPGRLPPRLADPKPAPESVGSTQRAHQGGGDPGAEQGALHQGQTTSVVALGEVRGHSRDAGLAGVRAGNGPPQLPSLTVGTKPGGADRGVPFPPPPIHLLPSQPGPGPNQDREEGDGSPGEWVPGVAAGLGEEDRLAMRKVLRPTAGGFHQGQ